MIIGRCRGQKGSELKLLREGGDDVISGSKQVSIGSTTGTLVINKGGTGCNNLVVKEVI